MTPRRNMLCRAILAFALPAMPLLASRPACAQATYLKVQDVVRRFVAQTGYEVIGLGSWITGQGYNPATSDHDLRLLLPKGGKPAQQAAAWRDAQAKLANMIKQEFGDHAGDVLRRTNLYAPSQLMAGVETADDALEVYAKQGRVPNLGYTGTVTSKTPAKYAEGLYGQGSQSFTQFYEAGKGRLFYRSGNTCVMGGADLTHLSEGLAKYTPGGTANTAQQWIQHCLDELAAGRGDKVAKYLERLERDLTKSRELAKLPVDDAFRNQLKSLQNMLKANPGKLADVSDDVARLLTRGRMEAAILRNFDEAGPVGRGVMRVMLDGIALKSKAGQLLEQAYASAGKYVSADRFMNGLMLYMAIQATAQAGGEGGLRGAAMEGLPQFAMFASLPAGALAMLTSEIMKEAEAAGYAFVANTQNAWDLMSGIYSAWGNGTDPDKRRCWSLADLVNAIKYENRLQALVYAQCLRAADRDIGAVTGQVDLKVADAIFAKCWPVIRDGWRWERDRLANEFLVLASAAVHTPILLHYQPNPAKLENGEARVTVEAKSRDGKLGDRLERMTQLMKLLYGGASGVAVTYYWTPAGAETDRDWRRTFTYDKEGLYKVSVTVAIQPFTKHTETEPRVMLRREMPSFVEVQVGGTKAPPTCEWCGQPAGTNPNCMQCTLYSHDQTQ